MLVLLVFHGKEIGVGYPGPPPPLGCRQTDEVSHTVTSQSILLHNTQDSEATGKSYRFNNTRDLNLLEQE